MLWTVSLAGHLIKPFVRVITQLIALSFAHFTFTASATEKGKQIDKTIKETLKGPSDRLDKTLMAQRKFRQACLTEPDFPIPHCNFKIERLSNSV